MIGRHLSETKKKERANTRLRNVTSPTIDVRKGQTTCGSVCYFYRSTAYVRAARPLASICFFTSERQERPSYEICVGSIHGVGKDIDQVCLTSATKGVPTAGSLLTGENPFFCFLFTPIGKKVLNGKIFHHIWRTFQ